MEFFWADDLKPVIDDLIAKLDMGHIKPAQVKVFRSKGSSSKARARIYEFPRIWQKALRVKPHYCVEFLSENFDHLGENDKLKVMIHELLHIPSTFSGALRPHRGKHKRGQVTSKVVNKLFKEYQKRC